MSNIDIRIPHIPDGLALNETSNEIYDTASTFAANKCRPHAARTVNEANLQETKNITKAIVKDKINEAFKNDIEKNGKEKHKVQHFKAMFTLPKPF